MKRFVSGGCDNLVKVWRYVSFSGNFSALYLAYFLFTSREDKEWVEEAKLEGHSDWVRDAAWAPSIGLPRTTIASCSQDRRVILWTNDGTSSSWNQRVLHTFEDVVWHVSWSVTGNILAVSGGDNKVSLWKETVEGQWVCISDVNRGKGSTPGQQ